MILTPEPFLLVADLLPEPMLLVAGDGIILAVNRACEDMFGVSGQAWRGRALADIVIEGADEIARYLQICARTRQMALGAITLRGPHEIACRVEGGLVGAEAEGSGAVLMLRLVPKQTDAGRFIALNLRIEELGHEIQRRQSAEQVAQENEDRLRITLASIGDAVISTDAGGNVTYLNAVAESLTGWLTSEAAGVPLTEVFKIVNEETRQPVENPAMRALQEGCVVGLADHTILIAKDGTEWPIDDSAAPIRAEEGRVVGCVLVFRDDSQRRRLERQAAERLQAAQFLSAIVSSSDDAIISKSLAGIVQSWNAGAERLLGYSAAQAVGRHISFIIPLERLDEEDQIMADIRSGRRIEHFDTVRMRRDGRAVHVSLSISPILDEDGRILGASKIARDISERKRAEQELHRLASDLSEAGRRKDEFLAILAHELRNPLAPIRSGLQIMRLSNGSGAAAEAARTMMERQVGQLVHLVDDLLDVSRISLGKLEIQKQPIELAAVLSNAVETSGPLIEAGGHQLSVDLPPQPIFVDADLTRLGQVFANLLNNAAKYSERGGRIRLVAAPQGSEVVVSIKDTGIGIAPDMLPKIFDMFTQVDGSLEKAHDGLGIGLGLAKRLVEMHGGSVQARSEGRNKGSEFVVRVPLLISADQQVLSTENDKPAWPSVARRILVADDNRDSADSLAMLLSIMGNDVRTVYDGAAAVDGAAQFRPDLILLDIGMPKLNGYESCRRIREQPWGEKVTLIALTGLGQDADKRRSQEAGFSHHLVKPVDYAALAQLLASLPNATNAS